jgi:hypothetical protein
MLKTQAQIIFLIHKLIKMQTQKMNLANIKGKLSRRVIKNIMAVEKTLAILAPEQ